jgi:hypothetical protein
MPSDSGTAIRKTVIEADRSRRQWARSVLVRVVCIGPVSSGAARLRAARVRVRGRGHGCAAGFATKTLRDDGV